MIYGLISPLSCLYLRIPKLRGIQCLLLIVILTLSGCSLFSSDQANLAQRHDALDTSNSMANLIIPEPVEASGRAQQALAKFNMIVMSPELSDDERAQFLFRRGLLFDSVGLSSLAFYDFQQAVRFDPRLHEAYNSIGIHHTVRKEYIEAYEAFDAVLEMDENYEFTYLNRGVALYYAGRSDLALADIQRYYDNDPQDAYRLLWLYLVQFEVNPDTAMALLKQGEVQLTSNQWSDNIVAFYTGKISQQALLNSVIVGVDTRNQMNERLCEAYFYLGKYFRQFGKDKIATNFFKLALSTNVYEFVEHRFSRVELALIRDKNVQVDATNRLPDSE
jgi:lipoprotein NlpI